MKKSITLTMSLSSNFLDEVTEHIHEIIGMYYGDMEKYVSSDAYKAFLNAVLDAVKYE